MFKKVKISVLGLFMLSATYGASANCYEQYQRCIDDLGDSEGNTSFCRAQYYTCINS